MNKYATIATTWLKRIFSFGIIILVIGIQQKMTIQNKERGGNISDTTKLNYNEKFRPQFHFSPPNNWMNDPNGMVYYKGEYHLFYQHYPDSNVWGPMHWGHAISKDLVHWQNMPIALYPDEHGYIFSGSAVVDWDNTSGFGTKDNPPLVAIYTYHDAEKEKTGSIEFQTQGIAFSIDLGRSWQKYEGNPVLLNPGIRDFRDPKVIWHPTSKKWIMALAVQDHVQLYTSKDLINWEYASDFGKTIGAHGGVWECPDLFPIVNNDGEEKWVLLLSINPGGPQGGSATQYFVGSFDGLTFKPDDEKIRWLDYGADNYAGVTWSDIPKEDGRRIFIGWMSNWQYANIVPSEIWRSAMTIPRVLTLSNDNMLLQQPVKEINKIINEISVATDLKINENTKVKELAIDSLSHLKLSFNELSKGAFSITLGNDAEKVIFTIDCENHQFIFDRSESGNVAFHNEFPKLHYTAFDKGEKISDTEIFIDASSIEIFVNNGKYVFTELVFPENPYKKAYISLSAEQATKQVAIGRIHGIW